MIMIKYNYLLVINEKNIFVLECQNLAHQMLNSGVSLIPYTVDPKSHRVKEMTREILRNVQLSRQKRVIVCSPRDVRDNLIEIVLIQVQ